ncbi:MAG: ribbon-helix-helix domain-containing protein [Deinococcales bacterium]
MNGSINVHTHQKISVSLPVELVDYATSYQKIYGLTSRSEVIAKAMRLLREQELIEAYKAFASEQQGDDPLWEMGIAEGLEPSSEDTW